MPFASFSALAESISDSLPNVRAVIDGEICSLDRRGRPQFKNLLFHRGNPPCFFAFDLLTCDGKDLRTEKLLDCKQELRRLLSPADSPLNSAPLFPNAELENLRRRWKAIQTAFVDEPRKAVEQADGLLASAMKRLAEVFAEERSNLERQWDRGDSVSTEDLRDFYRPTASIALPTPRSFSSPGRRLC